MKIKENILYTNPVHLLTTKMPKDSSITQEGHIQCYGRKML